MNLSMEFNEAAGYLVIRPSGEWTQETGREVVDAMRDTIEKKNASRVLLDMTGMSHPDSTYTRYAGGKYLAEQIGSGVRIAAVSRKEHVTYLAETVARNRGADLKVFLDFESAIRWLNE